MSEAGPSRCPTCGQSYPPGERFCSRDGAALVHAGAATDRMIGQLVADRYRVQACLASGGMGAVYVAEQINVGRRVALKVLRRERLGDDKALARFELEALLVFAEKAADTLCACADMGCVLALDKGSEEGARLAKEAGADLPPAAQARKGAA